MKLGILTTMNGSPWGGSELLWAHTAKQALLDRDEVCISVFDWTVDQPAIIELEQLGAKIFQRPRFEKPSFPADSCLSPFFECKADSLLISQGGSYDILYDLEVVQLLDTCEIPYSVICQFNSDDTFLSDSDRLRVHQFFSKAENVVFVSQQNLEFAQRHLARQIENATVVQNPVNLLDSSYIEYPKATGVRLACVARLEVGCKGQDVLLEVLSAGTWRNRDWSCHLYGRGPDKTYLHALSVHYGVADKVHLMGHVEDIRSVWADSQILVLPSRAEGTPLSLVEAMLCGRPAVVTDVGGNSEWIEEGKTGFIAESPAVRHLQCALEKAWLSKNEWENMGRNARNSANEKLDTNPGGTLLRLIRNRNKLF